MGIEMLEDSKKSKDATLPVVNSRRIELRILVYRRNHTGDPDQETKTFGINDCMGSYRDWEYDAVIGIGASKPWPRYDGIREKITWVGINPIFKTDAAKEDVDRMKLANEIPDFNFRGQLVRFEKFILWDEKGKPVKDYYPQLHQYMFVNGKIPRAALLNFPPLVYKELLEILEMAEKEIENPNQSTMSISMSTVNTTDSRCPSVGKMRKGCA